MCVQGTGKNSKEDEVSAERGLDAGDCLDHTHSYRIEILTSEFDFLDHTLSLQAPERGFGDVGELAEFRAGVVG